MALIKSMISSKSNEWATPIKFFQYLDNQFHFTLDPCSTNDNTKCQKHFTIKDNGLLKSWKNEVVFMNPPYGGHTGEWLQKAVDEVKGGCKLVVCLIVSSTDRSYWHEIIGKYASEIWFLRGRIKFGELKSTAPFASAIIIFTSQFPKYPGIKFIDLRQQQNQKTKIHLNFSEIHGENKY